MRESGKSDTSRREFLKNIGLVAAGGLGIGAIATATGCTGLPNDPGGDVYATNGTFYNSITLNGAAITTWPTSGVPTSRKLTINGTQYDLSADRSWTVSASASMLPVQRSWMGI